MFRKAETALVALLFFLFSFYPALAQTKLSQINGGASTAYNPATDQLVGVRSGTTDLLFYDLLGVGSPISGSSVNAMLYVDASNNLGNNSSFYWDNTAFALSVPGIVSINNPNSGETSLVVQAPSGNVAALQTWQDSSSVVHASINDAYNMDAVSFSVAGTPGASGMDTAGTVFNEGIATIIGSATGAIAIGSAVSGGTSGSVLYIDSGGNLAQSNPYFTYDDSSWNLHVDGVGIFDGGVSFDSGNGALQNNGGNPALTASGGNLVLRTYDSSLGVIVEGQSAAQTTFTVQGASSQSGNLLQIQDSSGDVLGLIDPDGNYTSGNLPANTTGLNYVGVLGSGHFGSLAVGTSLVIFSFDYTANFGIYGAHGVNDDGSDNRYALTVFGSSLNTLISQTSYAPSDLGSQLAVIPSSGSKIGQIIQGVSGQSANLQNWQAYGGTTIASVNSDGNMDAVSYSVGGTAGATGALTDAITGAAINVGGVAAYACNGIITTSATCP